MTAVNGNLIVAAGAPQNSIYGYVRVYRYDLTASHSPLTPSWIQMGQDLSGDSLPGNFGTNVALSSDGRILAVACDEYSNGVAGHFGGQVQVYCYDCEQEFTTTNPMWALLGSPLEGSENTELFGYSIALSSNGTILAVGSIGYSDKHGSQEGRVQVFEFQNNSWQLVGDPLTGQAGPFFLGSSVALSSDGSILATGAISGADNAGLVRVYQLNKTANMWTQMGTDIVGSSPNDFFGTAVSLSADGAKLAATADQHGGSRIGYARVYQYTNQSKDWQQIGQDLLGSEPGEQLGESIALTADGGYVIVGAPYPTSLNDSGVAFIYRATSDNN
jgi:WD40 repeat protein